MRLEYARMDTCLLYVCWHGPRWSACLHCSRVLAPDHFLCCRVDLDELEVMLRERLLVDSSAVATFASGLRTFLDDPLKVPSAAASFVS